MAEVAAVQRILRSLLAIIERMEREETKKIAKKTYEVFYRVSRAYGARHRNESGAQEDELRFAEDFGCEQARA